MHKLVDVATWLVLPQSQLIGATTQPSQPVKHVNRIYNSRYYNPVRATSNNLSQPQFLHVSPCAAANLVQVTVHLPLTNTHGGCGLPQPDLPKDSTLTYAHRCGCLIQANLLTTLVLVLTSGRYSLTGERPQFSFQA